MSPVVCVTRRISLAATLFVAAGCASARTPAEMGARVRNDGLRQLRGRRRRSVGGRRQDQDPPHRRRDRSGLRRQPGADRPAGRRLVRLRAFGAVLRRVTIKDGAVEQGNFDTYNSMRIAEMPKVESIIMPSGHAPWGGVGEPTILVAAPAVSTPTSGPPASASARSR